MEHFIYLIIGFIIMIIVALVALVLFDKRGKIVKFMISLDKQNGEYEEDSTSLKKDKDYLGKKDVRNPNLLRSEKIDEIISAYKRRFILREYFYLLLKSLLWSVIATIFISIVAYIIFSHVREGLIVQSLVIFLFLYLVSFYRTFFKERIRKLKKNFYDILEQKIIKRREMYNAMSEKAYRKAQIQDEIILRIYEINSCKTNESKS